MTGIEPAVISKHSRFHLRRHLARFVETALGWQSQLRLCAATLVGWRPGGETGHNKGPINSDSVVLKPDRQTRLYPHRSWEPGCSAEAQGWREVGWQTCKNTLPTGAPFCRHQSTGWLQKDSSGCGLETVTKISRCIDFHYLFSHSFQVTTADFTFEDIP